MWASGEGAKLNVLGSIAFPHSLGMYYTALTQYMGFWKFGDEYKVMGLAAYGRPEFLEEFRHIVQTNGSDGFKLGLNYFTHHRTGPEMSWRDADKTPVLGRMFSEYLEKRLGPTRPAEEPLSQRHHNLAATMQARLEEVYFEMLRKLQKRTGQKSICRVEWHSTAWRTGKFSRKHHLRKFSYSRRRATRGWPLAPRTMCITRF
jgi:carbamoyltransferase